MALPGIVAINVNYKRLINNIVSIIEKNQGNT